MTFGQPAYLYLIVVILPLLVVFYWLTEKRVRRRLAQLGDLPLMALLSRTVSTGRSAGNMP